MRFFAGFCFCFQQKDAAKTAFVEGGKTLNLPGGVQNESENNTRLQRMQAKKLRLYKKQEERS